MFAQRDGIAFFPNRSPIATDAALIAAIAMGDRDAMATLYRRHNASVYRYVTKLVGNRTSAEDITSDVFIQIWCKAGTFKGRSQVSTWIFAIARFKALATLRRETYSSNPTLEPDDQPGRDPLDADSFADTANDPEDSLAEHDLRRQMSDLVGQLSKNHQKIINLLYYEDKTIADIAKIEHLSKSTVKTRAFYARQRLARLMMRGKMREADLEAA